MSPVPPRPTAAPRLTEAARLHQGEAFRSTGRRYDAIWFGHTDSLPERARVAFRLDANEYNGVTKVQLLVEHAEPA